GFRESAADWEMLLTGLRERGRPVAPKLAVADGALGFWAAMGKVLPQTAHQRCWVHKTANVLNKLPKRMQPRVKESLQDIWMAESRAEAHKAFDLTLKRYQAKFPKAMECLAKDREEMLALSPLILQCGLERGMACQFLSYNQSVKSLIPRQKENTPWVKHYPFSKPRSTTLCRSN